MDHLNSNCAVDAPCSNLATGRFFLKVGRAERARAFRPSRFGHCDRGHAGACRHLTAPNEPRRATHVLKVPDEKLCHLSLGLLQLLRRAHSKPLSIK
jgi:hypothetical protein